MKSKPIVMEHFSTVHTSYILILTSQIILQFLLVYRQPEKQLLFHL